MKTKTYHYLLATVVALCLGCAKTHSKGYIVQSGNEADWGRYQPSNISEVIRKHPEFKEVTPKTVMTLNPRAASDPYRVRAVYIGEVRKLSGEKKELIRYWGSMFRVDNVFTDRFEMEACFDQESESYCFPIQSTLLPFFYNEVKKSDEVTLYTFFIGTVQESTKLQWVFLINEFRNEP